MNWLARLFARPRVGDDLAEEIRQHLEEKVDELVEQGWTRDEAVAGARRAFGSVGLIKEEARDAWGFRWLDDLAADARYGARQLLRQPALTAVCLGTLALGVGANAAVFSAVYTVLLRPLPFKDAGRLVLVSETRPGNVAKTGSPFARYQDRVAANTVFEDAGGYWDVSGGNGLVFGGGRAAERLQFSVVTSSFFPLLGVAPSLGRSFLPSDDGPSAARVFVASHALWRDALGGDPLAIGRPFQLDGETYTLAGVMPPGFRFPGACAVWLPVGALPPRMLRDRVSHQFRMIGRLRAASNLQQAQTDLDRIQQQLARTYPTTDGEWRVRVTPLLDELVGDVRTSLWLLFAAVAVVLLIACANVVNLLLARAVARRREFAVRVALGAGRSRLLRQTLTEGLLLAGASLPLALLVAKVWLQLIVVLGGHRIPRLEQLRLDVPVLAFLVGIAIVVTLLVGAAPGLQAAGVATVHHAERSSPVDRRAAVQRRMLVVAEVALTLLLVAAAGLLLRSFARLTRTDPGFDPTDLVAMRVALPDARYPRVEQRTAFLAQLLERVRAVPGVEAVAANDRLPLSGESNWGAINIVGRPLLDAAHAPVVQGRSVSADYFRAMRIPLLRGRTFTTTDIAEGRRVVVINKAMADQFWPGADPLGERIASPTRPADPAREIVGVVANVRDLGLDAPSPAEMYAPYQWWSVMNLVARSTLDASALERAVRSEVAALDSGVPLYDVAGMTAIVDESTAAPRFELRLLGVFAAVALTLAAVGVYGVLAFSVTRRTHDIGVRLALGASRARVLGGVIAEGMQQVLLGVAIGVLLAAGLLRAMSGLIGQVDAADPLTLAAASALLASVGALACLLPAHRATRVDPIVALRCE